MVNLRRALDCLLALLVHKQNVLIRVLRIVVKHLKHEAILSMHVHGYIQVCTSLSKCVYVCMLITSP